MLESACLNPQTGGGIVDPSVPWRGKTAYLVAKDGETRDAFRRLYFKYPDAFDWEAERDAPSMLTPEMERKLEKQRKRSLRRRRKRKRRKGGKP